MTILKSVFRRSHLSVIFFLLILADFSANESRLLDFNIIGNIDKPFGKVNIPKMLVFDANVYPRKQGCSFTFFLKNNNAKKSKYSQTILKIQTQKQNQKSISIRKKSDFNYQSLFFANNFQFRTFFHDQLENLANIFGSDQTALLDIKLEDSKLRFNYKNSKEKNNERVFSLKKRKSWIFISISIDLNKHIIDLRILDFIGKKIFKKFVINFQKSINFSAKTIKFIFPKTPSSEKPNHQIKTVFLYDGFIENSKILAMMKNNRSGKSLYFDYLFYAKNNNTLTSTGRSKTTIKINNDFEQRENGIYFPGDFKFELGLISMPEFSKKAKILMGFLKFSLIGKIDREVVIFRGFADNRKLENITKKILIEKIDLNLEISIFPCNNTKNGEFHIAIKAQSQWQEINVQLPRPLSSFMELSIYFGLVSFTGGKFRLFMYQDSGNYWFSNFFQLNQHFNTFSLNLEKFTDQPNKTTAEVDSQQRIQKNTNLFQKWFPSLKNQEFGLLFHRFSIFENANPVLFKILGKSQKNQCLIPFSDNIKSNICFECDKNSVLYIPDYRCRLFCPPGTRSFSGICVPCKFNKCEEINSPKILAERLNKEELLLRFSDSIPQINETNLDKRFILNFKTNPVDVQFNVSKTVLNDSAMLTRFNSSVPISRIFVNVSINSSDLEYFHDKNHNIIYSIDKHINFGSFRVLSSFENKFTTLLSIIYASIYHAIMLIGCFLFVFSFRNNIHDITVKRLLNTFIFLQVFPLMLFLDTPLPSIFREFLFNLYRFLPPYGFRNIIQSENQHFQSFVNFYDRTMTISFLVNFGHSLLIQLGLLGCYILSILLVCIKHYFSIRVKSFIQSLKNIFEFNVLAIAMFWTAQKSVFYASLAITEFVGLKPKKEFSSQKDLISEFSALSYISLQLCFLVFAITVFIKNNYFIGSTNLKFRLSFFFIGFRNTIAGNLSELTLIFFKFMFGIFLGIFSWRFDFQINSLLVLSILSILIIFATTSAKTTFLDKILEIYNESIFLFLLALICVDTYFLIGVLTRFDLFMTTFFLFLILLKFCIDVFKLIRYIKKSLDSTELIAKGSELCENQSFFAINQQIVLNLSNQELTDNEKPSPHKSKKTFGNLGDLNKKFANVFYNDDIRVKFGKQQNEVMNELPVAKRERALSDSQIEFKEQEMISKSGLSTFTFNKKKNANKEEEAHLSSNEN